MGIAFRVGLTGGIASGKTTVSDRFSELGVPVIDADVVARTVVEPGSPGLAQIVAHFGADVLDEAGALKRPVLRERVFNDPALRRELNAILHPLIRAQMDREAAAAAGPYLVLAIPLLIEGGDARQRIERILVVDVDEATQLRRLLARDGSSEQQARAILASQASRAARLNAADDVLRNDGSVTDLRQAVDRLHQEYLRLAAAGPVASHLT